jgi:hypothetical protein
MAITHVASVPTTGATQTATTSLALTIPATVAAGDILVIDASTQDANGVTCTDNDTGGNTWTVKEHRANGTHTLSLLWKRATAGTASKVATIAGGTTNVCGILSVYRGCVASGDPIEAMLSEANASGNNTQAAITTLTDGAFVCVAASIADDRVYTVGSADCTDPPTLTSRGSAINAAGAVDNSIFHASAEKTTAGSTGAFVWTWAANALGASRAYALAPAALGGAFTITADSGAFTHTGTAATPRRTAKVVSDAGTIAITGTAASLEHGYRLTADAGSVTLTGTAATTRRAAKVSSAAGAWALTGTAASLEHSYTISAAVGSLVVTGTDATFTVGGGGGPASYTLDCAAGSFTQAGTAATLRRAALVGANPGAVIMTGTAATTRRAAKIVATADAYAWTGTAATLVRSAGSYTLSAASGAVTITGIPARAILDRFPAGSGGSACVIIND